MNIKLQKKLLTKYKEFFYHYFEKIEKGQMFLPIKFGIECNDGWYMLLNELLSNIQQHIKNYNKREIYKSKFWRWYYNYGYWGPKFMRNKIGYWINSHIISKYIQLKLKKILVIPLTLNITQIKEKYGGLRFYYNGGDNEINGMVSLAESLADNICEECGSTKNVGITIKGWNYIRCKECMQKLVDQNLSSFDNWEENEYK